MKKNIVKELSETTPILSALFVGLMIAELPRALRGAVARRNWKPIDAGKFGCDVAYERNADRP